MSSAHVFTAMLSPHEANLILGIPKGALKQGGLFAKSNNKEIYESKHRAQIFQIFKKVGVKLYHIYL